jgi:uncharacterized protein (DUF433 family)
MADEELLQRIVSDPQICGGQPCIRGTRIMVATILSGLVEGLSAEQITEHFPSLNVDDIRAAVAFGVATQKTGCDQ